MFKVRMIFSVSTLAFVFGAAQPAAAEEEARPIPRASDPSMVVLTSQCPESGYRTSLEAAPLLALLGAAAQAILPPLFEGVIAAGADYLEKLASERSASSTASRDAFFWAQTAGNKYLPRYGCLIFARGNFGPSNDIRAGGSDRNPCPDTPAYWNCTKLRELHGTVPLIRPPQVYAEFALEYKQLEFSSDDETGSLPVFVGLRPDFLHYRVLGPKRGDSKKKQVIFEITMDYFPLSAGTNDGKSLISQTFDFGVLERGTVLKSESLEYANTAFVRLPQPEAATIKIAGEDRLLVDTLLTRTTVILTETEDGGDIERAIAKKIREDRSKIAAPLIQYIDEKIKELGEAEGGGQGDGEDDG